MLGALEDQRPQRRKPECAERLIVQVGVRISCSDRDPEDHLYEFRVPETDRAPGLGSANLLMGDRTRLTPALVESWPAPSILRLQAEVDVGPRPGDHRLRVVPGIDERAHTFKYVGDRFQSSPEPPSHSAGRACHSPFGTENESTAGSASRG